MRVGNFREEHPRLTLTLPMKRGELDIEFIVDTGFAGDLTLPFHLAVQLAGSEGGPRDRQLATGQQFQFPSYEILLDWNDDLRPTEVLVLEGEPLLGTVLIREYLLQSEMTEGGTVSIEPL
jgi:predicted aspartyl protease